MKPAQLILSALGVVLCLIFCGNSPVALAQQNAQPKDIMGGASLIFKRQQNPQSRSKSLQRGSLGVQKPPQREDNTHPQSTGDVNDKVEDALALGNIARDRKPPDFQSAEKAYRLAWKLNPQDPRPLVGLGNVYFDLGQLPEAAKAYREAIKLGEPATRGVFAGRLTAGIQRIRNTSEAPRSTADWHVYLAMSLLQQDKSTGAELELRKAISADPQNANWQALLGYDLVTQERYTEASALYRLAVQLEPDSEVYKDLLKQSSLKAEAASAQDSATKKRLDGTKWDIRESETGKAEARCQLKGKYGLCGSVDNNLRYSDSRWTVQDGLFVFDRDSSARYTCVGKIQEDRMYLKCLRGEVETKEVWTKIN